MTKATANTVLCAWELGGQLGHIARLSHLTQTLEQRGYQCFAALRDLSRALPFFHGQQTRLLQAPVWLPKVTTQRPIQSLADVLLLSGYLQTDDLLALMQAWRNLLALVNPEVLIYDYSPTAALAALYHQCRKILVGPGFAQPVPPHPLRNWHPHGLYPERVTQQEQRVVTTINQALARLGQPGIARISDLFVAHHTVITTAPEFDLYADLRLDAVYHCGEGGGSHHPPVRFSGDSRPRILAYLKPGHPRFQWLLEALAQVRADVFVVCPRANPAQLEPLVSEHFGFSVQPVNLQTAMAAADLFVGHGNAGTTQESLLAGTPVLALPIQLEQLLVGQTLEQLGVGRLVQQPESVSQLSGLLEHMLADHGLQQNSQRFAAQHRALGQGSLGDKVADLCSAPSG